MEYYSASRNSAFESVLMRWMNLEPIIQSEVSQKEKQYTNAYIWNLERWNDNPICETAEEPDVKNRFLDSVGEGKSGMI